MTRSRKQIVSGAGCIAIISFAADLSLRYGVSWRVVADRSHYSPRTLAARLRVTTKAQVVLELPSSVAGWFPIRFAIPDTVFALAVQYIWAQGVVESVSVSPLSVTDLLIWHLRHAQSLSSTPDLSVVIGALRSVDPAT